jgi:hypothetical protein
MEKKFFGDRLTLRVAADGKWWAMSKRETGWASYGFEFDYLGDLLDKFNATLVHGSSDKHGVYFEATHRE